MDRSADIRGISRGDSKTDTKRNLENIDYSLRDLSNIFSKSKKELDKKIVDKITELKTAMNTSSFYLTSDKALGTSFSNIAGWTEIVDNIDFGSFNKTTGVLSVTEKCMLDIRLIVYASSWVDMGAHIQYSKDGYINERVIATVGIGGGMFEGSGEVSDIFDIASTASIQFAARFRYGVAPISIVGIDSSVVKTKLIITRIR